MPAPDAPRTTSSRGGSAFAHLPQSAERLADRRIASEEDARVVRFERLEAPVGRAAGIVGRGPFEISCVDAEACEARFEAARPSSENRTIDLDLRPGGLTLKAMERDPAVRSITW